MSRKEKTSDRLVAERLSEQVFAMSESIRSVAVYYRGRLGSISKPYPGGAGWWDSDKYEELIVNPTLITLLRQRGNIDCGGIRHIMIRYGTLTQCVVPIEGGHISIAFEPGSHPARRLSRIKKLLSEKQLISEGR